MKTRGLGLILALAAGIATVGCARKTETPVAYTPPPPPTGLHVLDNRQPLARKIFANAGYAVVKYGDETRVQDAGYYSGKQYTDCYFMTKAKDDGHLYKGCAITNTQTETVQTEKTFVDLGTRVATLQP